MASPSSSEPAGTIPAPPGVALNFSNPGRSSVPFDSTTICLVLAIFFVAVRIYTRIYIVNGFGWDDGLCIFATIIMVVYCVTFYGLIDIGFGIDLWNIPFGTFNEILFARWNYVQDLSYALAIGSVKISILLLYFRIFNVKSSVRWIIYGTVTFVALYTVTGMLVTIFACRPLNVGWDALPYGTCLDSGKVSVAFAILQILSDFLIFAIPVPIVMNLQFPLRQRIGVLGIFLTGVVTTVASCVRLVVLCQAVIDPASFENATVALIPVFTWTTVELTLAIIISCAPAARPLFARFIPWLREVSNYSRYSRSHTRDGTFPGGHQLSRWQTAPSALSDNAAILASADKEAGLGGHGSVETSVHELKYERSDPDLGHTMLEPM